jgi:proteic killer suppression protein
VIKTFHDRVTVAVFAGIEVKRIARALQIKARTKLLMLDKATTLTDLLSPPGNRLEKLRGDRAGQFSIRVDGRWRICFSWDDGEATDVEFCDYH